MSGVLEGASSPIILSYSFRRSRGDEFLAFNANIPLLPASNMKIITGYAVYSLLGKKYKLSTSFTRDDDTLVVSGGPTPFLFSSMLRIVLDSFDYYVPIKNRKIKKVKFIDPSIDNVQINPYWIYGDSRFSYQSKITNFSINENCTKRVHSTRNINPQEIHKMEREFRPVKDPKQYISKGILFPSNEDNLRSLPSSVSLDYNNHVMKFNLVDLIQHMEYESCNFSAEVLFKLLSSHGSDSKGSWSKSAMVVRKFITPIIGKGGSFSIVDGSGLSRHDLFSTSLLSGIIHSVVERGDANFLDCLPSPGKGTLRGRLERYKSEDIFAKTGSLGGVACLSGYIKSREVSFSIIVNNYLGSHKPSLMVDKVLSSFLENNEVILDTAFSN